MTTTQPAVTRAGVNFDNDNNNASTTAHSTCSPEKDVVLETQNNVLQKVLQKVHQFYYAHQETIKKSHGIDHVMKVYDHTCKACNVHVPSLSSKMCMKIKIAALLHDADDSKYFPNHTNHENARSILKDANVGLLLEEDMDNGKGEEMAQDDIIQMIDLVSCSKNGNTVPPCIVDNQQYHLLIPRWADRLEAVGAIGVVRCYQYNTEHNLPLSSNTSPRPTTEAQVWDYATPERFQRYIKSGGTSSHDMISHYYDKLLHIARPPPVIVRNTYLENQAYQSSRELVEMCIRFGKTGTVDEMYIHELEKKLSSSLRNERK